MQVERLVFKTVPDKCYEQLLHITVLQHQPVAVPLSLLLSQWPILWNTCIWNMTFSANERMFQLLWRQHLQPAPLEDFKMYLGSSCCGSHPHFISSSRTGWMFASRICWCSVKFTLRSVRCFPMTNLNQIEPPRCSFANLEAISSDCSSTLYCSQCRCNCSVNYCSIINLKLLTAKLKQHLQHI